MKFTDYPDAQRAAAVITFDARFGKMEQVLWCLSVNSRAGLLAGESSPVLEALVWTIKSWWGVQGVRSETKAQMARALAESMTWSADLFGPGPEYGPDCAGYACQRVAELVSRSMSLGVPRREYSLASKVLHWLMPWRVPVYDSFVRGALDIPTGWDHPQAYRKIAEEVFALACAMIGTPAWIGSSRGHLCARSTSSPGRSAAAAPVSPPKYTTPGKSSADSASTAPDHSPCPRDRTPSSRHARPAVARRNWLSMPGM